jgi:hypothetical protein
VKPENPNSTADEMLAQHVREASRLSSRGLAIVLFGLLPIMAWTAVAPLSSVTRPEMALPRVMGTTSSSRWPSLRSIFAPAFPGLGCP